MAEEGLTLVGLGNANADFTFGSADNKFVCTFVWPRHARDGGACRKLVADRLLFAPICAELVDEDDVVGLSDGKFLRVGREGHSAHDVAAVALLSGSDRKFILLLALIIKQVDNTVRSGDGLFL